MSVDNNAPENAAANAVDFEMTFCEKNGIPARAGMWNIFSDEVVGHICDYTVGQYGDFPNDLRTESSDEVIMEDMRRYMKRFDDNKRGSEETARDMLKIAHYASMLWCRLVGVEQEWKVGIVDRHSKPVAITEVDYRAAEAPVLAANI